MQGNGQAFQACKFAQKTGRSACLNLNLNLNLNVDAVPVRAVGCAVRAQHKCLSLSLKMSINFDAFCDHAAHGRLAIVQEMLESGEVLFEGNEVIALVSAVENGHVDVVDYLLRHAMFDPSARDNYGNYAIGQAAEFGHLAIVERLLQDPRVDPSADYNCSLRRAADRGHIAVVERLLQDKRVDPSASNNVAVRWAAERGHLAVVERLLQDERVDPSADDNYAVRLAAQFGHLAVVDRLLEVDRVDFTVAIRYTRPEHLKRFECRERLTEICIALQAMELPAWVTVQILDAARPWSTLPLHSKWNLVCAVKHYHDKHPAQ
jgi:hypothetical protein